MKRKERETLIDIVRGFAMVCVVLGHCIQEGSGLVFSEEALYFQDRVYQFLYSFHMPLFMLISGYLAWKSVSRAENSVDRWQLICRRCFYLVVPIWGWGLIDQINIYIQNQIKDYQLLPRYLLHNAIVHILTNLWFLWAILICFLLVCLMHYSLKDNFYVYVCIFLLMFVTPDGLGLGVYKYMIPYYLIGFYYHKYLDTSGNVKIWINWENAGRQNVFILTGSGAFFLLLFSIFEEKYFIYLTGYKLIGKQITEQLWIDAYRFLIGFTGSIFFISLWSLILYIRKESMLNNILSFVGRKSLGIYILSGYVIMYLIRNLAAEWAPDYLVNGLEGMIVLALSVIICIALEKIPFVKKLIGTK